MAITVAQFSDLHYSADNLEEADRCFGAAVTEAICNGVHAAVITGDSTDHALDAHTPAMRALAAQVKRLSDHCPVLMLQGTFSHEPVGFLKLLAMTAGKYRIAVAESIGHWGLIEDVGFIRFDEGLLNSYSLVVSAMPTLNKAHIATLSEDVVDAASEQARNIISRIIRSWGAEGGIHERCRAKNIPTMAISHGTVFNSISEHGVPMAGTDHELGIDTLFAAGADAVALGHIHMHQVWEEGNQKIAYPGSIGRFHYGEKGDKGWITWTLDATDGAEIDFRVTPSRRNVEFSFEGPPDLDQIRARLDECVGAHVRVTYVIDEEHKQGVDRKAIQQLLDLAAEVKIEGRICIVQRQRARGISTQSMTDKLATWCAVTSTEGVGELQERMQLLEARKTTDEIVGDFLKGLTPL